jgi:hypothetical protein
VIDQGEAELEMARRILPPPPRNRVEELSEQDYEQARGRAEPVREEEAAPEEKSGEEDNPWRNLSRLTESMRLRELDRAREAQEDAVEARRVAEAEMKCYLVQSRSVYLCSHCRDRNGYTQEMVLHPGIR